MSFKKYFISLLLLVCAFGFGFSMTPKESIYKAYINGDMEDWKAVIDSMNTREAKKVYEELELLGYEYGYIGWCLSGKNKKTAKEYMKRFDSRLTRLEGIGQNRGKLLAYRAAYYGFEIGLNEIKAPFLGKESLKAAEMSVKTEPENWLGFVLLGNIDFYKPAIFGGSKQKALENYLKAEKILLDDRPENDWNVLALLSQIAITYEALEDIEKANDYYKKILGLEPDFEWVRDELYIEFKEKYNLK